MMALKALLLVVVLAAFLSGESMAMGGKGCVIPYRSVKCRKYMKCPACFRVANNPNERCVKYANFSTALDELPEKLTILRLASHCHVTELTEGAFSRFTHLRKLHLQLCGLTKNFTEHVFDGVSNIEELKIDLSTDMKYYRIADTAFGNLNKLKRLTLLPHKRNKKGFRVVELEKILPRLSNITEVTVSTQYMQKLDLQALPQMPSLRKLNISNNGLQTIPVVNSFPNLRYFVLSCNELISLNLSTDFPLSTNQLHVDLSRNHRHINIERDDFKTYGAVKNLSLDLSGSLREINQGAFGYFSEEGNATLKNLTLGGRVAVSKKLSVDSLRHLLNDLANSSIEELHFWGPAINVSGSKFFEYLQIPTLRKLALTECGVHQLWNSSFHGIPNLESLDLTNARITKIHNKTFNALTKLKTLIVDRNFPSSSSIAEIVRFVNFKVSTRLTTLKMAAIGWGEKSYPYLLNARGLHILDFSNNFLEASTKLVIVESVQLKELYLNSFKCATGKGCLIVEFTQKLSRLEISDCPCCMDVLANHSNPSRKLELPALQYLNVSRNDIGRLQWRSINVGNLRGLNISEMRSFNISQMPRLKELAFVNLAGNNISAVGAHDFAKLPSLEYINLDGNAITFIDARAFSHQQDLKTLRLYRNRFACDCQLRPFRDWVRNKTRLNLALVGKCATPHFLNTTYVDRYELGWLQCNGHLVVIAVSASAVLLVSMIAMAVLCRRYYRRRAYQRLENILNN